jgi:hypothetical protein
MDELVTSDKLKYQTSIGCSSETSLQAFFAQFERHAASAIERILCLLWEWQGTLQRGGVV